MTTVISVEHLSKAYRLGQIGAGTMSQDIRVWWAKMRGKPNPLLKIGETNHGNRDGEEIWALRDVGFTVEQGEVLGIIGRNGAGKSTLLKILTRVTAPTSGKIKIKGRIASLLEVGTGFHPELTGRENTYLNGAILGMRRNEVDRKFDEIVDFAGIEKFIDTPVKRYSSGMYVRLAFAVAAHLEPEILLVDEVLAVGDAAFQKKCLGKMGAVANEGRTVIFVSHNMRAIAGLTNQCLYIQMGRLKIQGVTKEIIDTYLSDISRENQTREGFADISFSQRGPGIVNPIVQYQWVRTMDMTGKEKGRFIKGQPMIIEAGFQLREAASGLQFGIGVKHAESGVEVFISSSPIFNDLFCIGNHVIKMMLEPNFLHTGLYSIVLKLFTQGVRQDTIGEVLFFEVIEDPTNTKDEIFSEKWATGLINAKFNWSCQPKKLTTPSQ